jgi:hypothetical protein
MPITRITPGGDLETETTLDVFHIQESIEVYDGTLALAIDHLLNHIKTLISLAYLPGSKDLEQALKRHPELGKHRQTRYVESSQTNGKLPDRILLGECQRLLDAVLEIAHLAAWPETASQAQVELENLRREVPFLDYRYDNDPYPSDMDHEETK